MTTCPVSTASSLQNVSPGAGEMAQRLKALAALAKDLDSDPSNHTAAHNCSPSCRGSDALCGHHIHSAQTHTHRQITHWENGK